MQFTLPPDFDPLLFPQKSPGCGSVVCRRWSATTGIRGCIYLFLVPQLCWKEPTFLPQWMGLAPHLLDASQPSLENSCLLSCGQLYISPGLAPGLEVWNTVFACLVFFTTSKSCHFTTQEPSEGFSRGEISYKTQQGRKTVLDMLQLLSWIYKRGFFFCYLGSRSVWVKLPVPLHHKSLCQPVNQTLAIKMGQLNCWVACFGWLGWTALF